MLTQRYNRIVHGEAVVRTTEWKSQSDWYPARLRCTSNAIELS